MDVQRKPDVLIRLSLSACLRCLFVLPCQLRPVQSSGKLCGCSKPKLSPSYKDTHFMYSNCPLSSSFVIFLHDLPSSHRQMICGLFAFRHSTGQPSVFRTLTFEERRRPCQFLVCCTFVLPSTFQLLCVQIRLPCGHYVLRFIHKSREPRKATGMTFFTGYGVLLIHMTFGNLSSTVL